jgi:hypothetical protein
LGHDIECSIRTKAGHHKGSKKRSVIWFYDTVTVNQRKAFAKRFTASMRAANRMDLVVNYATMMTSWSLDLGSVWNGA